jgi:hypothetical protein
MAFNPDVNSLWLMRRDKIQPLPHDKKEKKNHIHLILLKKQSAFRQAFLNGELAVAIAKCPRQFPRALRVVAAAAAGH